MTAKPSQAVFIDVRCYGAEHESHSHDFHQLVLPLQGELALEINGQGGIVDSDHAAVICAHSAHGFAADKHNRFIVADVPVEWANMLDALPAFFTLSKPLKSYIHFIAVQLEQSGMSLQTRQQIMALLLDLMKQQLGQNLRIDKRVDLARHFLEDHISSKVSLAQVAQACHLSVRQLSNLFKQQMGMSPLQYLRECRMKQAVGLLTGSDKSIQAIAESVGYHNLAAFSDRFNKHFGKSPSHFRQTGKN